MHLRVTLLLLARVLSGSTQALGETRFAVDPEAGNNTFSAVFDAAIGERITAVSSASGATLRVDEAQLSGQASCAVPLSSIRVDNDDTKSDHFRQWATNKKVDPRKCTFKLEVPHLKLEGPVEAMKPVPFEAEGTFTICGRPRDDKGPEKISGRSSTSRRAATGTYARSASARRSRGSTASATRSVPAGPMGGWRACSSWRPSWRPMARSR